MVEDSEEPQTPETPLADPAFRRALNVLVVSTARREAEDAVRRANKDLVSSRTLDGLVMESLRRIHRNR